MSNLDDTYLDNIISQLQTLTLQTNTLLNINDSSSQVADTEGTTSEIIGDSSNINVNFSSSNLSNLNTMPETAPALQKLHLDAIPFYDGNPSTLSNFLSACEYILNTFSNLENLADPTNEYLLRAVLGKLTGRALLLVGSRDVSSWKEIKSVLEQCFGDQRDEKGLLKDLQSLKPARNESPYQFGMKCQDARCLLLSKLKITEQDANYRKLKTKYYDEIALEVFLDGLPTYLDLAVRLRHPDTLEKAMSVVLEEENHAYRRNRPNNIAHNTPPKMLPRMPASNNVSVKPNFQNAFQPIYQYPMPVHQPMFLTQPPPVFKQSTNNFSPNFSQKPTFSQHTFNRPVNHQFNNKPFSNFGQSSKNQFNNKPFGTFGQSANNNQTRFGFQQRPNNNHSNNLPKPTPMDTSSGNTALRSQRRPVQPPPPRFVFEELFYHDDSSQENQYPNNRNDYCVTEPENRDMQDRQYSYEPSYGNQYENQYENEYEDQNNVNQYEDQWQENCYPHSTNEDENFTLMPHNLNPR